MRKSLQPLNLFPLRSEAYRRSQSRQSRSGPWPCVGSSSKKGWRLLIWRRACLQEWRWEGRLRSLAARPVSAVAAGPVSADCEYLEVHPSQRTFRAQVAPGPLTSEYGTYDSQGQILAFTLMKKSLKPFTLLPLRLAAVYRVASHTRSRSPLGLHIRPGPTALRWS